MNESLMNDTSLLHIGYCTLNSLCCSVWTSCNLTWNDPVLLFFGSSVFGSQLDIHSGGIDLAFPHHENEIAQCEAYHKCDQWGNYFLHSGKAVAVHRSPQVLATFVWIRLKMSKYIFLHFAALKLIFLKNALQYNLKMLRFSIDGETRDLKTLNILVPDSTRSKQRMSFSDLLTLFWLL